MKRSLKLLTFSIFLSMFIFSCDSIYLKCDNSSAIELVKKTQVDIEKEYSNRYRSNGIEDVENYLQYFMNEIVEIKHTRLTKKNDKIKSCNCEASIKFKLKPELLQFLSKNSSEERIKKLNLEKLIENKGLNVKYKIQITDDGGIYVSTRKVNHLQDIIISYSKLSQMYNEAIETEEENSYKFMLHEDGNTNYCYNRIETNNNNLERFFILKLKISGENVSGTYRYNEDYGVIDWYEGDIIGKINKNEIYGTIAISIEDTNYKIPIKIQLYKNNIILEKTEKITTDNVEKYNQINIPRIFSTVNCNDLFSLDM